MTTDQILLVIGLVLLAAVAAFLWWRFRPRPQCPECGAYEVGLISKEPLGMHSYNFHRGEEGGGYSSTQLRFRVRFRCNQCGASWTKETTETN